MKLFIRQPVPDPVFKLYSLHRCIGIDLSSFLSQNLSLIHILFCHEEEAKAVFDKKNQELCDSMTTANTYANILMPIMGNMGNILYVLLAIRCV